LIQLLDSFINRHDHGARKEKRVAGRQIGSARAQAKKVIWRSPYD